ncbi:hypothetical protein SLEP1_g55146 [Rubroshorea leprosula]|uniref:Uncharacterized protein n=1 Tax=Rubroshorea leprosula TaxID=152421 RepID=A0AAV5MIB4_9ROSI|nr:hypothetical protein SLEP1_g55146 [Rubroshorea leprosula]
MDHYTRQKNPKEPDVVPQEVIDLESMDIEDTIFLTGFDIKQFFHVNQTIFIIGYWSDRFNRSVRSGFKNLGNNGEEKEDQFVSGLKIQNDAKVQIDGCKVAEEAQDEGGLEDVLGLSDNDDDETILARDNLRNFRANQIGVASSSARAGNVDVGVQDENDGETQFDDEVSYISTSNEEDEEIDHVLTGFDIKQFFHVNQTIFIIGNNGKEEEDQFVSGLKVQNDAKVQTDGCKVAEEAQDEGGLEDVLGLSDNDDDETILARDNLRNFRANQIGVASSSVRAAIIFSNVDVVVQDEDYGETQSDDEVSYISTSNEEDEEVNHGRRRKARHKVQNDAKVQTNGCKVAEEAQEEGGLEDVPGLSDNDDDETVLARDNLRNFRANQIGVASSSTRASNVDVGVQDEDDGETQFDDEVSYISTSNEEDEEVDHGRRRKARHKVYKEVEGIPKIELGMIFLNEKQF